MKTFTTYAEKKAKQFLNLLQGYTKGIRITAILILLLIGVSNAWAADVQKDAIIYFDNSASQWSYTYHYFAINESYGYKMTKINNTLLYVHKRTDNTWGGYSSIRLFATTSSWGDPTASGLGGYNNMKSYGANITNTYNNYTFNANNYYYIKPDKKGSASSHANISVGHLGSSYSSLNKTITVKAKVSTDGGSSYAEATSPGTLSASSYKFTTYSSCASATSLSSGTITCGYTANTTLTAADATGYTFVGWYDSAGTEQTTEKTLSINPTADATYYAYYKKNQHTVLFGVHSSGHGSLTAKVGSTSISSGNKVNYGSEVVFTAKPDDGYQIEGWYSNSACDIAINNGTNDTYTATITGGTNVYVKFVEIPVNSHNITYTAQGTGWTYGNSNPTTAEEGATVTFVVNPTAGYRVDVSSDGPALTGPNANNQYTFTMPTKDVKITVDAKPEQYTVTLNKQSGTGGTSSVTATYAASMPSITAPTRTGYTFNGYFDATSGGTKYYNANGSSAKNWDKTSNTTLYAQWTAIQYTITYKEQGDKEFSGTHANGYPTTHTYNTTTTLLGATKSGYTFAGWYRDSECAGARVETLGVDVTEAITLYAKWNVASYTINFDLEGGTGGTTTELTVPFGAQLPDITIPTKAGYLFLGYYNGDNGTGTQYYDASGKGLKTMPANNLTLHAKWLNGSDCIFFYNNLGWSNVFVYFYSSDKYWDDSKGTGSQKEKIFEFKDSEGNVTDANHKPHYREYRGKMTKIEGTNIWYYNRTVHGDITKDNYTTVAFTKDQQNNYEFFYDTEVVRRADYNSNVPMFVSMKENKVTKNNNKTSYYNTGYWMNYPANTGYKLHIFDKDGNKINDQLVDIPFEYGDNTIMPWSVNVSLEGSKTYAFKIQRDDDTWYGNNGTMTTNSSGDAGQTAWEFTTGTNNCKITTTAPGTYVFTLKYGKDRNNNYNYLVGVEYPASVGDYRLVYQDNAHPFHPGHLLKKRVNIDTVSFFVHYNENPVIILQQVTKINANTGAITWGTLKTYALTANQPVGDNPGQAMISGRRNADEVILHIGDAHMDGVDATGIYNFVLEQTDSEATLLNTATKYDGNFYIRTNAAAGGWGNFRQNGNKMTYTSYADNHDFNFNHYFVEWINAGTNVKFTIANDYSYCLSDTLDADDIVTTGNLPDNANVRFGWNSKTNELSRAYIAGSSNVADRYLVLIGNAQLTDTTGKNFSISGLKAHEAIFADKGNWIYQLDAKAGSGASIQLTAKYNNKVQTFFETDDLLSIEDGNSNKYPVRMVYDFKSNQMLLMLIPVGKVTTGADVLIERTNQGGATQVQSTITAKTNGYTVYATMTFTKEHLEDDKKTNSEKLFYWVSFPFNVRISDVSGFGEYGKHWIIQYYDGEKRAREGCWIDSPTFWTFVTDTTGNDWNNGVLQANRGYILVLANDINSMGLFTNNNTSVSLYFPSREKITTIGQNIIDTSVELPAYTCTIERDNRKFYDSNWHMIGVPSYSDKQQTITQDSLLYYYAFNPTTNQYTVTSTKGSEVTFKSMHSYLVQFAGTINWRATWQLTEPQGLAARRDTDSETDFRSLRLELQHNGEYADQTFVQMQSEQATAEYDMNIDLTKFMNAGANIYTLTSDENIQLAGNVLPLAQTTIALGVVTTTDGEYTFTMPEGTDGMVVELIDYVENTTTNLLFNDYIVNLPAGTYENRFALHVQPSKVVTNLDNMLDAEHGTKKYIINGQLIIQTSEGIFNAQGTRL